MIISNQRIRLAIDTSQMGTINDVLTGATPQFWNGVDVQFEIAIFYGATLASISNLDSITVDLKAGDPRTGLPLMSQTIASGSLNQTLTLDQWNGGATADCHALLVFNNSQTNLDLGSDAETFWLVISALTSDSPSHKLVLGATPLNVVEAGEGVEPPASVVSPIYFTAAQSDARFARTVDLTTINTHLSTLDGEMTSVTATANGALPKSGGTISGTLAITGLSGVLKASSGTVAGSATTSDLGEGSNLYWTQARFNTALAAIAGAASGICPLDSSSLIPAAYLPSITVHNTFVVASQSAMLALAAHQGDVAIRTDLNESFILGNNTPSVLANWSQLLTPVSSVISVNGASGTVTLTTTSVAEGSNLYYTAARARTDAIAAVLTGFSSATGGNVVAGDTILAALGRLENRCTLNDAKLTGSDRVLKAGDTMTGALQFSGGTNPGLVLSNLTDTQRIALTPVAGTVIYDTTLSQVMIYNGSWQALAIGGGTGWFNGSGAPASGLGSNGNYYLDDATGNIYLKASGAWSIIYSPTVSGAVPAAGGTMTGQLKFTGLAAPIDFGFGWALASVTSTTFALNSNSGANQAFIIEVSGGGTQADFVVGNGNINIGSNSYGLQVAGIKVVGTQQAHITHDASGAANQATVNAILAALEAHGLVHS